MTSDDLERRLHAWYRAEIGPREAAPASVYSRLAEVAETAPAPASRLADRRALILLAAALVLLLSIGGTIAIGSGLLSLPWAVDDAPPVVDELTWTPSSIDRDWPAPIRAEPGGDAVLVPLVDGEHGTQYADPTGDVGPAAPAWIDIDTVRITGGRPSSLRHGVIWSVRVELAADIPLPVADPRDRWIAYGVVVDTNGDGVPDLRLGMDNTPVTENGHRAWRTELDTGTTTRPAGAPYGLIGGRFVDTYFPGELAADLAEIDVGQIADERTFRFYAWTSLIEDGRVVATDYAPDVGWLEPAPEADP